MNDAEHDEYANNILAAGGLMMMLHTSPVPCLPETIMDEQGRATNKIRIRLHYMKSPYIVTVERDPSEPELVPMSSEQQS